MNTIIQKAICVILAGSFLAGITGCRHKTDETALSAASPTQSVAPAGPAESAAAADTAAAAAGQEDSLSIPQQLNLIAGHAKKWHSSKEWDPSYEYYAVTDLDQNGRLEIIASTGPQGSGRFTWTKYYQVDEAGTGLKKCKTDYNEGDSENDVVSNISTAYYDENTGEYHYLTGDFATAGAATGHYSDISAMTLKDNRVKNRILAFYSEETDLKKKTTVTCRFIKKSGKETELDPKDFDRDAVGDRSFSKYAKLSVNIAWFQFDRKLKKMTKEQLLASLEQSFRSFSLGYPLKQAKQEIRGFQVMVPQFESMEDGGKQMRLNRLIWDAVAADLERRLFLKDTKYNKKNPFDLWLTATVKYAGRDRASILMEAGGIRKEAAHGAEWAYTINLDLAKEVKLSQKDILPEEYRQTAERLFMEKSCTVIRGENYWKFRKKEHKGKLLDREEDWEYVNVYQTADSVGIIIDHASYAAGSYAIYEVRRDDFDLEPFTDNPES